MDMAQSTEKGGLLILAAYLAAGWWLFAKGLKRHVAVLFHLVQAFSVVGTLI